MSSRYYVLEDGVPLPAITKPAHGNGGSRKYPFETMQIGQSFLVPHEQGRSASVIAGQYTKSFGMRFATRSVDEGLRVWRLAPKGGGDPA